MLKLDGSLKSNTGVLFILHIQGITHTRALHHTKTGARFESDPCWFLPSSRWSLVTLTNRHTHRDSLEGAVAGSICSLNRDRIDTTGTDA